MERYLRRMCQETYEIPKQLWTSIRQPGAQIVASWFIIQQQTPHTYISLHSCRAAISPECTWEEIGVFLKQLLDLGSIPIDLLPLQSIGHGNTMVVIGHSEDAMLIAIKQQVFSRGSWEISSHILEELLALQDLRDYTWSPDIMFHSVSQDMVQIGMEFIPLSMKQMVRFGGNRHLEFSRRIIRQLLHAVRLLHICGRAHRDIKPDNIRFRANGTLVLIDYDSCIRLDKNTDKTRRVCTAGYRDPFLFDESSDLTRYDYRTLDAFSVGAVILFVLLGGKHGFTGPSESDIIHSMRTYNVEAFCSRSKLPAVDGLVLCGLLAIDPGSRMTITEAYDAYKSIE